MNELVDLSSGRSNSVVANRTTFGRPSLGRPSLGEMLDGAGARHNAFDTIRLLAAMSVIVSHSFLVTTGSNLIEPLHRLTNGQTSIGGLALAVFFTISGVFISASFERSSSLASFARKRALRLLPALFVAIAVSALVLGPLVSTLPATAYFASGETWVYFANAAFLPNTQLLPGVFGENTLPYVNGSMWTLKFEVLCYAATAVALMTGRFKQPLVVVAWLLSFVIPLVFSAPEQSTGAMYYVITGAKLFRFFGAGVVMYLFRHKVPVHGTLAAGAFGLTVLATSSPMFLEAAALFGSYAIIVFGYLAPQWFAGLTRRGDISYGVYVYGWPIQQLVWPIGEGHAWHWVINSVSALLLAMLAGAASWIAVEKPALKWKSK